MENQIQKINCLLCGSHTIAQWGIKNMYTLYQCVSCKLVFVYPLPDSTSVYTEDYFAGANQGFGYVDYDTDKEPMRPVFEKYLDMCGQYGVTGGSLFDVGAATGFFLILARARGFTVSGVEMSQFATQVAQKKGLAVSVGDMLSQHIPHNTHDVVTMFDVIEHMTQPFEEINEVYRILKPGGLVVVNTPNGQSLLARLLKTSWHLVVPPEHLFYFSPQNLSEYLSRHGFTVLYVGTVSKHFTFSYIFKTLYKWQKIELWNHIAEYFIRAHPHWSIPINLYDNFLLIARKNSV